jgi:hypothetical protein
MVGSAARTVWYPLFKNTLSSESTVFGIKDLLLPEG